jgi:hypothetical protein
VGGPTHYVVTPTQVEVELRLSWAVTTTVAREGSIMTETRVLTPKSSRMLSKSCSSLYTIFAESFKENFRWR